MNKKRFLQVRAKPTTTDNAAMYFETEMCLIFFPLSECLLKIELDKPNMTKNERKLTQRSIKLLLKIGIICRS